MQDTKNEQIEKELKTLSATIDNLKNLRKEDLVSPVKKHIVIDYICPNAKRVEIDTKTMFVNGFRGKTEAEVEQLIVDFLIANGDKITVHGGCQIVKLTVDDYIATLYSNLQQSTKVFR